MRTLPILKPSAPSLDTSSPSEIDVAEFSGEPRGAGRRIVVVVSRFNEGVTVPLAEGAVSTLVEKGVVFDNVDVLWVPGAWELPVAVRRALSSERYDAAVALGAVIRGETPHFDIVAGKRRAAHGSFARFRRAGDARPAHHRYARTGRGARGWRTATRARTPRWPRWNCSICSIVRCPCPSSTTRNSADGESS